MAAVQHVVAGRYQLGQAWVITLPEPFAEQVVEGRVLLRHSGLTVWLWEWTEQEVACCPGSPLDLMKADLPETAYAFEDLEVDGVQKFAYRLQPDVAGQGAGAFHGYASGPAGVVEMTAEVADDAQAEVAKQLWLSLGPA